VRKVETQGLGKKVLAEMNGRLEVFSAEQLLVATGLRPNTDELGLEKCGVTRNSQGGPSS